MNLDQPAAPRGSSPMDVLFQIENEEAARNIPDWLRELKPFLPPDLWRKLAVDPSRRGYLNNALNRLQSLLYAVSTYLPGDLVQEKIKDPAAKSDGKMVNGCLLFSDVSGFTALSEKLAGEGPKGAEALTEVINRYFTEMIDVITHSNGILLKFAGDATLVFFPEQENGEHAQWAARAGLRMMRAMQKFTNMRVPLLEQPVTITMKIGLSAGSFLTASVGSEQRMEYALIGSTVSQTLQAEGCTKPGDIVANQQAADLLASTYTLEEVKAGFHLLKAKAEEKLDEYEITLTKRMKARSSAVQWDASLEEIQSEINEKLTQIKALTPYLASELVERIIVHVDQRQLRSEYRPTTVMFCNFTGPDTLLELWGEAGAKRVTEILSDYFIAINKVITRFGGIVSRIDPYSQGTKLLALFGAPVAHEDDAQRAISAALEMNRVLAKLNQEWKLEFLRHLPAGSKKIFIEHRIGITLGDTFAGQAGASTRREYTVMGDEVNLAARLMSTARTGQILISQPVFDVTDAYYITHKLPSVLVKGKKNPIEIWQVDGPREDTLQLRIQNRPMLIGRASELEHGWQFIQRIRDGGGAAGNVLTIAGQAGLGKSHLADKLIQKALAQGWQFHACQCRSYLSQEAYYCWKGILCSLAGIAAIDHILIQKDKLDNLTEQIKLSEGQNEALIELMQLSEARSALEMNQESGKWTKDDVANALSVKKGEVKRKSWDLKILRKLVGDKEDRKREDAQNVSGEKTDLLRSALTDTLSAVSSQKPLIVFFEDAQWMDDASKTCLEAISSELASRPILFLLALRTQETVRSSNRIELKPFEKAETQAMVAEILTAGLVDMIHTQSGGSPLFVEEISRWLKHEYKMDENRLKDILQNSDTLQRLVLSRVERLPEGQREVARQASVIGMEFRNSEVKALMDIDAVTLHEYLTALEKAGLIEINDYSVVDNQYAFLQPIFRNVLYASLSFERRNELHNKAARNLTQATRDEPQEKLANFFREKQASDPLRNVEKLAYHYEMSGQFLEAARQLLGALETFNLPQEKAEELCTHVLTLLEHSPIEKADAAVSHEKARAQLALGGFAFARLDLAAATAFHEAAFAALPAQEIDMTARLCMFLPSQGKSDVAEKHLNKALGQHPQDWKLHAISAWLEWRSKHDPASQIEACRASLPEAESTLRVRALMDDLSGNWEKAAEAYQLLNESASAALAWIQFGDQLLTQRNIPEATKRFEQAAEIWQDADFCGMALVRYRQAEVALIERHKAKAVTLLKEAIYLLEKSAPALRTEPRKAIDKALTLINTKNYSGWQYWRWQPFDDLIRIRFCLPLFQEVK
jgi:class 3 adenylate cyclase/tetratricopeptide (TPR) repeat protein